jgi:hypothetical protein
MRIRKERFIEVGNVLDSMGAIYQSRSRYWEHREFQIVVGTIRPGKDTSLYYKLYFYTRAPDLAEKAVWLAHNNFEQFLDYLPSNLQEEFLFHLDLFT